MATRHAENRNPEISFRGKRLGHLAAYGLGNRSRGQRLLDALAGGRGLIGRRRLLRMVLRMSQKRSWTRPGETCA